MFAFSKVGELVPLDPNLFPSNLLSKTLRPVALLDCMKMGLLSVFATERVCPDR